MNVLLVRPPTIMGREGSHAMQHPVNLCWLAAYIGKHDFRTRIIDYEVRPYTPDDLRKQIQDFRPRIIGFTAMTPSIENVAAMAQTAQDATRRAICIAGGAHVSILPVETLHAYPQLRAVVMGEGEQPLLEICRAVRRGELGETPIPSALISKRDGTIVGDPGVRMQPLDLDSLPLPARELLDLKLYTGAPTPGIPRDGRTATQLFTARGCPGRCIFCCSEHVYGHKVRTRSIRHVMAEVRDCIDRFGFKHFTIDNDTFTYDRDFVMQFCSGMSALPATWDCDTRVDRIDEDMVRAMADSGCLKIAFGVETGSEKILKLIKKGITHDQVRAAFDMARRAGVMSCAFLMLGNHPEETEEDIEATNRLVAEIQPDLVSVALATPYPGTELRAEMLAAGILDENLPWSAFGQSFQGAPFIRTLTISPERLLELQTLMLRKFFLRPKYILRRLARLKNPREFIYWTRAGLAFLKYTISRKKQDEG